MPKPNHPRTSFGYNLKRLRKAKSLSQFKLAEAVGTKQNTITRWERSLMEPAWAVVLQLCDFFEVECTEFSRPVPADDAPEDSEAI